MVVYCKNNFWDRCPKGVKTCKDCPLHGEVEKIEDIGKKLVKAKSGSSETSD